MRYLLFCLITILLISSNSKLVARQYNIDYLLQLIEDGNKEEVQNFFAKPDYVTKIKHAIEFAEDCVEKINFRRLPPPPHHQSHQVIRSI